MAAPVMHEHKTGMSLRLKLTIGLILIIGIIFAALNTANIVSQRLRQRDEALRHNETVARLLAGAIIPELANYEIHSEQFGRYLRNLLKASIATSKSRDLAFVAVIDNELKVIAGKANTKLTVFPHGKTYQDESQTLVAIAHTNSWSGTDIRMHRFPLKVAGSIAGKLLVGTSLLRIKDEATRNLFINLGALILALAALMIYAIIALNHMVITPVTHIANAMRAVQEGNLSHEVALHRKDEIGVLANTYNFMVRGLKEREQLKDAFSRYVSPQVYKRFQEGAINLRGETRKAVVLFSDIRSFTTLSEQLTPVEVVAMLNEYFTEMVEIIFKYDGFINKFIGDAIMAIYNVPIDQPDPELRAIKTGLEMLEALDRLNQRRQDRGQFTLKIGIGINTGPVVAGNLGHERRLEYTVIGDMVNLAQRIESQTKVTGTPLLVSQSTFMPCYNQLVAQELPPVKVKGKKEPVVLYSVSSLL
ncbi:MAG: adenylate/guanylate cyclase domain-containing protein [Deltaproteobacteria bacterium]|nr:adenylate/guanylate cyclase domain-containing protein [Deltaproteobacteria bacterium]